MNKRFIIAILCIVMLTLVISTIVIKYNSEKNYEDYSTNSMLPSEMELIDKDIITDGFYEIGSAEEALHNEELLNLENDRFNLFMNLYNESLYKYQGTSIYEDFNSYSDTIRLLSNGTTGNLNSLIGCINSISEELGINKNSIKVVGDSLTDDTGNYYTIELDNQIMYVYFTSNNGVDYAYVK